MYRFKSDKYKKARGGHSRLLNITCEKCGTHIAYYQKDGPGMLKRMYVDRFVDSEPTGEQLSCANCGRVLATRIIYQKENRPAYRLYVGAINKKIVRKNSL